MTHLSSSGANAPPHSSFDTGGAVSFLDAIASLDFGYESKSVSMI